MKALESDDPFLQQAARLGLQNSLKTADLVALAGSKGLPAAQRLGLLLILRESDRPDALALLPIYLSDPDARIRFAAIQWVGERRLTQFRPRLEAALASSAETRDLFEATLAAIERLNGKTRRLEDEIAGEEYVAALLKDARTPTPVLQHGLRMLRPDHPALTINLFRRLLKAESESVRIEAVRSLSQSRHRERFEILASLADDPHSPLAVRAEAVAGLADDATAHRERLLKLASGENRSLRHDALRSLRGVALNENERSLLRISSRGDAEGLELVEFLAHWEASPHSPPDQAQPPTSDVDAWLTWLSGPADAIAGEQVFFHSKGPGCYRCHQVQGRGSRVGPDLTTLAAGIDRRRLVESIVAPSKEIAPQFVTYAVARNDGTVFTGVLLEQSADGDLVFADSQGRRIPVKRDEIAERKPQAISTMPAELPRMMTKQEMRDLLAFLLHSKQGS